jgi:hypothetical protein
MARVAKPCFAESGLAESGFSEAGWLFGHQRMNLEE